MSTARDLVNSGRRLLGKRTHNRHPHYMSHRRTEPDLTLIGTRWSQCGQTWPSA